MQFNSYSFAVFFAVLLVLHSLPLSWRLRKGVLLAGSYLFYMAWDPPFVVLLWISTLTDWWVGRRIHAAPSPGTKRAWLLASLGVNLGLLGYFKYRAFLLANLAGWTNGSVVFDPGADAGSLILPIGISFYTFQTLSYSLDIYRGTRAPSTHFLDFALYVTFFPQLVAGPIVRSDDFLPQCEAPRRASAQQLSWGFALLLVGLFQKVVLADALAAPLVEAVFDGSEAPDAFSVWCGSMAFAVQVFCDFAGYSTCAIGVAMCLGFSLPDNFRAPYGSIGFNDFWGRWHITLSSWLRDYVFVPFSRAVIRRGGRHSGEIAVMGAALLTMSLCGLWHGAGWTFVLWGAIHGALLVAERIATRAVGGWRFWQHTVVRFGLCLLTFAVWCWTVVIFRASSVAEAGTLWRTMLGAGAPDTVRVLDGIEVGMALGLSALLFSTHWCMRERTLEDIAARVPAWALGLWLAFLGVAIATIHGEDRAFIYFQF